ncbi:MAG: hypothetical protein ABJH98_17700 [Reichenbachiella sp.]|uniref:hypothetical protein n=1 Tax=Reichenbachiella sp. TaxID=2184521 RepID=UPI00329746D0
MINKSDEDYYMDVNFVLLKDRKDQLRKGFHWPAGVYNLKEAATIMRIRWETFLKLFNQGEFDGVFKVEIKRYLRPEVILESVKSEEEERTNEVDGVFLMDKLAMKRWIKFRRGQIAFFKKKSENNVVECRYVVVGGLDDIDNENMLIDTGKLLEAQNKDNEQLEFESFVKFGSELELLQQLEEKRLDIGENEISSYPGVFEDNVDMGSK